MKVKRHSKTPTGINNGNSRHAQQSRELARELLFDSPSLTSSELGKISTYVELISKHEADLPALKESNPGLAAVTETLIERFRLYIEQLGGFPPAEEAGNDQ
jgi:hypothetical protein